MKNRLLEERKKLGVTQEQFAQLGGVPKRTYCDYEYGISEPKASFLAAISLAGADVAYILTGIRTQPAQLSERQKALLDNYEHTDEQGKNIIEATAFAAAKPEQAKKQA